jgi:hypothetical protein
MNRAPRLVASAGPGLWLAALLFLPFQASAGPRPYGYTQGFDSLAGGSLELESWFSASRRSGSPGAWDWWLGPVAGITDRLETSLFAIFQQTPQSASAGALSLGSLRAQASYQLAAKAAWPVDLRVRLEYGQPVAAGESASVWLLGIASRSFGPLDLTLNVGGWLGFPSGQVTKYLDHSLGASVEVLGGLRLGAEAFGGMKLADDGVHAAYSAGPSLAYGRGRFWLSGSFAFAALGKAPDRRGRLVLGVDL